ncbi:MAG: diaminopimelate decarboxylase [Spirochaetales bacterium]|nr:MAG: diaminopimelate decarboxylase [Spirochaetales bacterium]
MNNKTLPFDEKKIREIAWEYPTPFHIYDEKAIRENARKFMAAFDWAPSGFKNYFAVKAAPNPWLLRILAEEGMGTDSSSLAELVLSEAAGITGENVFFTSNDTPLEEYRTARKMGAIINLDDITHLSFLEKIGLPDTLSFRYNPGAAKKGNAIIGKPEEAKYGLTYNQMFEAYTLAQKKGVTRFGIHTMVASNELNPDYFVETAEILLNLLAEIYEETGISIDFVNFGGGIGIPYRPEDKPVDLKKVSDGIKKKYTEYIINTGCKPPALCFECGRVITGPYGYLVTEAIHEKHTYKEYIGVNSSMADLMRPALYGAYHHITVLGKEEEPATETYDVVGSLCENNDKFAIDRKLPRIERGDLLVFHDTGAHGRAMGFNYNGKLRAGELLLKEDGSIQEIRRRESLTDYFATLDFPGLS